jgi:hypothetical protein
MRGLRYRAGEIPAAQAAIVGADIRVLRQRNGWTQAKLGELMGWRSNFTVCAAEGRCSGRQRGFAPDEVQHLASIFDIKPWQLTTPCVNCDGQPPRGFTCESCGHGRPRDQRHDAPSQGGWLNRSVSISASRVEAQCRHGTANARATCLARRPLRCSHN